ncbi:unnamed protein product [Rotaria sp. Silwood1]|nr:unnamed protein product [Rotaria sp. Silwood1]CAF4878813.1 unnamed protein product [Rotaria sp. Silwood1]
MACHSKRDEILIYDKNELILYNVKWYFNINTTIKKIHGTQLNHLISLTYVVQDKSVFICCHDPKEIIRQHISLTK